MPFGSIRPASGECCRLLRHLGLRELIFFFVVAGEEDLATKVEAVDQAFDGAGRRRSHRREVMPELGWSQTAHGVREWPVGSLWFAVTEVGIGVPPKNRPKRRKSPNKA